MFLDKLKLISHLLDEVKNFEETNNSLQGLGSVAVAAALKALHDKISEGHFDSILTSSSSSSSSSPA